MRQYSFNRASLIECSKGKLFTTDAPRLPKEPMLAFDSIEAISAEGGAFGLGFAQARKRIASLDHLLASHFIDDPIVPGSLLVEGLLQLTGFFGAFIGLRGRGRATRIEHVEFRRGVTPADDSISFQIEIVRLLKTRRLIVSSGLARAGSTECMIARGLWVSIVD
jgi:3-hydroxyacyl-[acyl-carrier protein] dehydratase / trans-2-decenoyl-[acyl-carrier protein] isomerase